MRPRSLPAPTRGSIVLWGMMGTLPFGGMVWQVYHYLIALRQLGYDVWYVEDSDRQVYDPVDKCPTMDYTANINLLARYMERLGFADRWIFRPPGSPDTCVGARDYAGLQELYREAAAALNLCGAQEPLERHDILRCRIYIETDPVENQVAVASGNDGVISRLDAYDILFTYGQNLGAPDCPVPMVRHRWHGTRPPVNVDDWLDPDVQPGAALTTIANWSHQNSADIAWKGYDTKDVRWDGHVWRWSKKHEFLKFRDVGARSALPLAMALTSTDPVEVGLLERSGWQVTPAQALDEPEAYRRYIQRSRGEFTAAKEQYAAPRSGWFSDRSVCYLASGRPVITQETGFGKYVPTGSGLLSFSTVDEALAAIEAVHRNYAHHAQAAAEIAREYFDGRKVVGEMLAVAGIA